MKKVGIATFYYVDNYGALLQTYAQKKMIDSFSGYEAEIIPYIPEDFTFDMRWYSGEDVPEKFAQKRYLFEDFLRKQCGMELGDVVRKIDGEGYDIVSVGSDQIWNFTFSSKEFLLPHVPKDKPCFAYAASIGYGRTEFEKYLEDYRTYLPRFRSLSLREDMQIPWVEEITGEKCERVVDPTLLLCAEDYEELIAGEKKEEGDFIFFFWLKHDKELMRGVEFANRLAAEHGCKIIHTITNAPHYLFVQGSRCMFYEGVDAFLWYIKNAKFVVTNSYHSTLFSMQFRTPFYMFTVESMRSRNDALRTMFPIEDRTVEDYRVLGNGEEDVDFDRIEQIIGEKRESSLSYLRNALGV